MEDGKKYKKYVEMIKQLHGISEEEIERKIDEIMQKEAMITLPNGTTEYLLTREGAARLLFKRMGGVEKEEEPITVERLMNHMQGILYARVVRVGQPRDVVTKRGETVKALDLIVGDATGGVPTTIWGDDIYRMDLKEGQILVFSGSYYQNGRLKYSSVRPQDEADAVPPLPPAEKIPLRPRRFLATMINDFGSGEYEVRCTIVSILRTSYLYHTCPYCKRRVSEDYCRFCEAGVTPVKRLRIPVLLDDGTARVRCVLWDDLLKKITGKDDALVVACETDSERFYRIISDLLLMREVIVVGRMEYGEFGWELRATDISCEVDIDKEMEFLKITK